ncbi:alpha/beta fold hydrolase [Nocardia suismassiliense]|uniref:alpha/beta fold hydrolase n=1 Tax=Nocardia suismassiliense TaxID=2077092 RepID=UPI000D1E2F45|nr:alpha/beta fold hydrolase [Nocardia suismassiliense]
MSATPSKIARKTLVVAALAVAVTASAAVVPATADPLAEQPRHSFAEYQGIPISIYEYGPSADQAPTVVTTGGWPGDSTIFEDAARALAGKYHVVRYDHRGEGLSGHDLDDRLNSLENLAGEFGAVIDQTAPGHVVHTYTEGWGSYIMSEYAFRHPGRIASLSSIGAPSLDLEHYAVLESGRDPAQLVQAVPELSYFAAMSTPILPELFAGTGLDQAAFSAAIALGGDEPINLTQADLVSGVSIYRANMPTRLATTPAYDYLEVPVLQVFQSPDDAPYLIDGLDKRTNNLWLTETQGSHANFGHTSWPVISTELDKAITTTEPH